MKIIPPISALFVLCLFLFSCNSESKSIDSNEAEKELTLEPDIYGVDICPVHGSVCIPEKRIYTVGLTVSYAEYFNAACRSGEYRKSSKELFPHAHNNFIQIRASEQNIEKYQDKPYYVKFCSDCRIAKTVWMKKSEAEFNKKKLKEKPKSGEVDGEK